MILKKNYFFENPQKTSIVITTISLPTESIKTLSNIENFDMVVVGDRKTPTDWNYSSAHFISFEEQNQMEIDFVKKLPINHYSRKMIGYLYAIASGAQIIIDTDDDNLPKSNFKLLDFGDDYFTVISKSRFINIYNFYSDKKIWPRGFPLKEINVNNLISPFLNSQKKFVKVGVWQGLVDKDPDVDAIYRLISGEECYFNDNPPIVLEYGNICPFNSQNTIFRKEIFPLLYLPTTVSFRFTDILRGLVAQPIMWSAGFNLGFTNSTAIQERNPHDLLRDFESEFSMYLNTETVVDIAISKANSGNNIEDNLFNVYNGLYENSIVKKQELELLGYWLKLQNLNQHLPFEINKQSKVINE